MPSVRNGEAIVVEGLTHEYPSRKSAPPRLALRDCSIAVQQGEMFGLLGPNGSGKSTLFRILTGLLKPTRGSVRVFEFNIHTHLPDIRRFIGVTFQHPSLDRKLTVAENLMHQGHLYGLRGNVLKGRVSELLIRFGMADRANDLVEHLSGGLQRRAELAKGLLHEPRLLLLDEPSTGLDPGARHEFNEYLKDLQLRDGITVMLTTHILEEAEQCDRIAILDEGKLVALGTPPELTQQIGGDVVSVLSKEPAALAQLIHEHFHTEPLVVDGVVRIERDNGHAFIPQLVEAFPGKIDSVTVSKPTLEDVFIQKTGHRFWEAGN